MPEAKENSSADKVDENTKLSDNNGLSEDVDVRMSEEEQETGENKARNDEISNGKDESKKMNQNSYSYSREITNLEAFDKEP